MYILTLKDNNKKIMSIPGSDISIVTLAMVKFIKSKYQIKSSGEK